MSPGTREQAAVLDWLSSPATYGVKSVERIDTHAAAVFLAGARAYKLKRAVRFDYLDFSTLEHRRFFCEEEVRLNRRTAPHLYRRVLPVTRAKDGSLQLDGDGPPVEWLIEMERFDQEALLDRLAATHRLGLELAGTLAEAVAEFHLEAERRMDHGGVAGMQWVVSGNAAGFAEFGGGLLDAAVSVRITERSSRELDRHAALLESRREAGCVRHCHGDLHLGNIVLLNGRPTVFDGVEFNDEIACIDVLYDLAFLLMDLWHRRLPAHANVVLNRYLDGTGDLGGLPLLPLFLSCRAAVRAKTSATAAHVQPDERHRQDARRLAREYLDLADTLLRPAPPCLVAIGGFSGSGKSTIAREVAPALGAVPGALVLRSDAARKRMAGVDPHKRLGGDAYTAAVSDRVYARLAATARAILRTGHSVIVDAVFALPEARAEIEAIARAANVPFSGVWLEAPEGTLVRRVAARQGDVSDADPAVVRTQVARGAGELTWHRVDASKSSREVASVVHAHLSRHTA
jgi:aminoglycoside phosphotransferase family enzyme/predicted kinase